MNTSLLAAAIQQSSDDGVGLAILMLIGGVALVAWGTKYMVRESRYRWTSKDIGIYYLVGGVPPAVYSVVTRLANQPGSFQCLIVGRKGFASELFDEHGKSLEEVMRTCEMYAVDQGVLTTDQAYKAQIREVDFR